MRNLRTVLNYIRYCAFIMLVGSFTNSFGADYYVSLTGSNNNDGSSSRPWRTIQHAVSRVGANQGHRIIVAAGTYVENGSISIPGGTTLTGSGIGKTIVYPGSGLKRAEQPYIALGYSMIIIRGSATLSNMTLDGQGKSGASGLWVQNTSNVNIKNVEVKEFFSNGICIQNSRNVTVEDVVVKDCSWASSAWVGKGFFLQDVRNSTIRRARVVEREQRGNKGGGNAFGILPREGSVLENVLVEDCYFEVHPTGIWNSGKAPNIVIEFWGKSIIKNVVLRRNEFRNGTLSFAIKKNQQNVNAQPFGFKFEQNRIVNGSQYPIELSCDNSIFQNNYIQTGSGYIFKNWEKEGSRYEKLTIQNNVVEWSVGAGWPTVFIGSYGGYKDLVVRHNTLYAKGSNGFSFVDMYNPNKFGNISENFLIENNIVYREAGNVTGYTYPQGFVKWLNDDYSNPHTIRNATVRGNIFWNFPAQDNGKYPSNRQENVRFTRSGAKPFPFYSQTTGKGADFDLTLATPEPIIPTGDEPVEEVPEDKEPEKLALPILINSGGGEYTTSDGTKFRADMNFTGSSTAAQIPININNTQNDPLYQSERYGKEFSYEFPLDSGMYDIFVHLSEIYWSGEDQRVFSLEVNGEMVLEDIDIFAEAGKGVALIKEIPGVKVTDGKLNLNFSTKSDHAKVSAIEIHSSSAQPEDNTPPEFQLSAAHVKLPTDFEDTVKVQVNPLPVLENEKNQNVIYSIVSTDEEIAKVQIDPKTGTITFLSMPGKSGVQTFQVIADDQQNVNNIATQELKLSLGTLIDEFIPIVEDITALRINAGGEAYTAPDGKYFMADNDNYLSGSSKSYVTSGEVEGTEDDPLYLSERWGKEFSYNVLVAKGTYQVRLHFAEIFWKGEDYRIFNIDIENNLVNINDLDVFNKVGEFTSYVINIENIPVTDGNINISFSTIKDNAKLSAIEIINTTKEVDETDDQYDESSAVRINCGSNENIVLEGKEFMADKYFSSSSLSWTNKVISEIGLTQMDLLYLSERYAKTDRGSFSYNIPVDNGEYIAHLHFAEIYFGAEGGYAGTAEGRRIINAKLEGKEIFSSMDIVKEVKSSNAHVVEVPVTITDGAFDLVLGASTNRPKISAIEIIRKTGNQVTITEEGLKSGNFKLATDDIIEENSAFVRIAPNPAVNQANLIIYDDFEGYIGVQIFDALGRLYSKQVIEKERTMGKYELDISRLKTGIYIITIDLNGKIHTQKLWVK